MGNQLEKQYNIKQKPTKLVGTYSYLRHIDHPSQPSQSLILLKPPHKVGLISDSTMILPVLSTKQLSSCTVAVCPKCIPMIFMRPQSEAELKIIIYKLIKNGTQLGRCFFSQGRILIWAEQTRGFGGMSPQEFQNSKVGQKSQVFTAGLAIANYLHIIYEKVKKGDKPKKVNKSLMDTALGKDPNELVLLFDPKDRKQYSEMIKNLDKRLSSSYFWDSITAWMQDLLNLMLQTDRNARIDKNTLLVLTDFMEEKQLLLYITLADDLEAMQLESAVLFMQILQFLIAQQKLIEPHLLKEYFIPVMILIMKKKRQALVLSCLIQVPEPPTNDIFEAFKKSNSKSVPLMRIALSKKEKLYTMMKEDEYNGALSRMVFCWQLFDVNESFECDTVLDELMISLPFFMQTITEENYKKEFLALLVSKVLNNELIQNPTMLLGLKAAISVTREQSFNSISKFYTVTVNPLRRPLQVNLHFLQLFTLMIQKISPPQLIKIMVPKLQPFLSSLKVSDQLYYTAQTSMKLIMKRLASSRNLTEIIKLQYEPEFFNFSNEKKSMAITQNKQTLLKKVLKDSNPHINWLKKSLGHKEIDNSKKDLMNE